MMIAANEGTAATLPLSEEQLEEHFRRMLPRTALLPLDDLAGDIGVGCVDGRRPHCVAGAPGGNAGLLILLLAVWEESSGPLSAERVDAVFERYLDHFGSFYLHTDSDAQERLGRRLAAMPDLGGGSVGHDAVSAAGGVDALVLNPAAPVRNALLELLLEPEHLGCGHLRLLLEESAVYGVRRPLAEAVLRSFFTRLWGGDARLVLEVLDGEHVERAVARVRTRLRHDRATGEHNAPALVTACPRHGPLDLFVYHPDAVAWLQALHAVFLARIGAIPLDRMPACIEAQRQLGQRQLDATLRRLAAGLPVFDVGVEHGAGGTAEDVTVRLAGRIGTR
jgi:hypothetical protein